ncbi:MAG: riboflavin synthase [Alphaproteobacteria bacterium]|nr:MAG: riboflavin synthase [Alphaproteobacteria bacterium]
MFTGIVTDKGQITRTTGTDPRRIVVTTRYSPETIELGASIAVDGICLTVVDKGPAASPHAAWFAADVSAETLARTTAQSWEAGRTVNLERALKIGDELGGHIVTGHVDATGQVRRVMPGENAYVVEIAAPRELAPLIAEKGSIAVDGVSLTVNAVRDEPEAVIFTVNLVPFTRRATTLGEIAPDRRVNLEIDPLARYIARWQELHRPTPK